MRKSVGRPVNLVPLLWGTRGTRREKAFTIATPSEPHVAREGQRGYVPGRGHDKTFPRAPFNANGTTEKLSDLNMQMCVMLKDMAGFADHTNDN